MIAVTDLERRFPGAAEPVLRQLTFEVAPGKLVALLGKSGSGKTTLLRCLVGLEPFDRGVVTVNGVQLSGADARTSAGERAQAVAAIRERVGLVFQSFELFPHLTVLDNCTLALRKARGVAPAQARDRAMKSLDQLGLASRADAFPEHLSGGQRQRVAIARALVMDPQVLLYDEPTSALDPSLKWEVLKTLRQVKESKVTQIVVTHDIKLARTAAESVFILD
ncbi:MAG TPA: ATP-binding cassette domain-containing protein, partial [Myxococcaceae bacterium]|nr:ATP-binding cassette domain-containing protein [Myxococcaceae bacterium]